MPKRFWEDFELGDWSARIRNLLKDKVLPPRQFDVLDGMGFPWIVPIVRPLASSALPEIASSILPFCARLEAEIQQATYSNWLCTPTHHESQNTHTQEAAARTLQTGS